VVSVNEARWTLIIRPVKLKSYGAPVEERISVLLGAKPDSRMLEGDLEMKKPGSVIIMLILALVTFGFASIAQAQATRTWVSGVGDDANPCSRTAPCKTFAGAISKTAAKGEINALDSGGFGAVTITKSITIDGNGHIAGVLVSGTNGIVVNAVNAASTDVVTLRNLDIDGLGTGLNGISILGAKSVHIEHCQIFGFTQNAIRDNRTSPASPLLFVDDSYIRNNAQGISITGVSVSSTRAFVDNSRIHNNTGFGIAAINANIVNVTNSNISGNGGEGVKIDTNSQANVISCVLNNNLTGALNNGGFSFLLADTSIMNNNTGVSGAITTFGNNNVRNNGGGNTLPAPVGQQ
jgi:hypothetical protein